MSQQLDTESGETKMGRVKVVKIPLQLHRDAELILALQKKSALQNADVNFGTFILLATQHPNWYGCQH